MNSFIGDIYFNGKKADIKFYSYVLSQDEINALYNE